MRIKLTSVMVQDQAKALAFYTEVLGFEKRTDLPMGAARWLTVGSRESPTEVELLLEPTLFPPARVYQRALYDAGIPVTAFGSSDIHGECKRLKGKGVVFRQEPSTAGSATVAVFEDTCGNLVQLYQV